MDHREAQFNELPPLDRMIVQQVDYARSNGITAWEIENRLRQQVGICVHQSVTGNLRHLVELQRLLKCPRQRFVAKEWRHIYVSPAHYSIQEHGQVQIEPRQTRRQRTQLELVILRRRIANSRPRSSFRKIMEVLSNNPSGLTCRELESGLGLSHQTVSARLTELDVAGYIEKTGLKRRNPGQRRGLSVYRGLQTPPDLFEAF